MHKPGLLSLVVAGCTAPVDVSSRIDVATTNDLGIKSLVVERSSDHDRDVSLLQAFAADGSERASVQVTRGVIELLPQKLERGSEIIISIEGRPSRATTREVRTIAYSPDPNRDTATAQFLTIPEVQGALVHDAELEVTVAPTHAPGSVETSYGTACSPDNLNVSPVARGCCEIRYYVNGGYPPADTWFFRDDNVVVSRRWSQYGGCKGQNGESCDGAGCYFGPNGFARAVFHFPASWEGPYPTIYGDPEWDWYYCQVSWNPSPAPSDFADLAGNFPVGQGCPGGDSGEYQFDY